MKKTWNVPSIETLDVRMTESGKYFWYKEGTITFRPDEGDDEDILDVGPGGTELPPMS